MTALLVPEKKWTSQLRLDRFAATDIEEVIREGLLVPDRLDPEAKARLMEGGTTPWLIDQAVQAVQADELRRAGVRPVGRPIEVEDNLEVYTGLNNMLRLLIGLQCNAASSPTNGTTTSTTSTTTVWTLTFASTASFGAVGALIWGYTTGFTPAGLNVGSASAPVAFYIASATTIVYVSSTSPGNATVQGTLTMLNVNYANGQGRLCVGDGGGSVPGVAVTDTALTATSNRYNQACDSTFPSVPAGGNNAASAVATFQSTFPTGQANFVWNEWAIDKGGASGSAAIASGDMFNHKGVNLITKTSAVAAALNVTVTQS